MAFKFMVDFKEKSKNYLEKVERRPREKPTLKLSVIGWMLVLPYVVWSLIFWIYPTVASIPISLFDASIIGTKNKFVGFQNFIIFITSIEFRMIMYNMIRFWIMYIPLAICLSMIVALMLDIIKNTKLRALFAIALFIPNLTSSISYSVIFSKIFNPNSFLSRAIYTISGKEIGWFSDPGIVLFPIAIMIAWKSCGYYALILLANISTIPKSYHEAAVMDGAGPLARFFKITLPVINPTFLIIAIYSVTTFFLIFGEPYLLTGGGGPMFASYTFKLEQFHQLYERLAVGMGAAVSIVAGLFAYAAVLVVKKLVAKEV